MINQVVNKENWTRARLELLEQEKQLTRLRDAVSRQRQQMPWQLVKTDYAFEGPEGSRALSELFENRHQLIVYHFMYGMG